MTRSKTFTALALALALAVAGCGEDEEENAPPAASQPTATATAESDTPGITAGKLSADQAANLDKARTDIADFCAADGKTAAPVGSVAIIEALASFDPQAAGPAGTVEEVATAAATELRGCGERKLAKRITDALKAAA